MSKGRYRNGEVLKEVYSSSMGFTVVVLAAVGLLEVCMLIYTMVRPELFGERIAIYRTFYIALLSVAVFYLGLYRYVRQDMDGRYRLLNVANPICATFFFLWALGISYFDMKATGIVDPSVFMTFSMTVPISFFLFPGVYIPICVIADVCLLFLVAQSGGYFGAIVNSSIFMIFQLLLGYGYLQLRLRLSERVCVEKENAMIDAMTGLGNRRGYAEAMRQCAVLPPDFRYLTVDINGLKEANDHLGHDRGDALITGAARCLESTFGAYGQVFRIGGDEFAVLLRAGRERMDALFAEYAERQKDWSAKNGMELVTSCGCASAEEQKDADVHELAKAADQRMYDAKEEYYRTRGKERRRR